MRARAGNLLVFWTRTADGIDPCSFHSGEARACYGYTYYFMATLTIATLTMAYEKVKKRL